MGKTENTVDIDYLRQRLRYEPETGKLYWLYYEGVPKRWLTRYANKEAFTANNKSYKVGEVARVTFKAHRVAWALYYGEWPKDQIDHINGIRYDNRIVNLRVATNQENMKNARRFSTNTSGVCGVSRLKKKERWQAYISTSGKRKNLGHFNTLEDAVKARKDAEVKNGYHENHGRD